MATYSRRLIVLLAFGLAHTLLHPLEILHRYAMLGFLLIPLRGRSTRTLVVVGAVSLLLPVVVAALSQAGPSSTAVLEAERGQAEAASVYTTGSLPELLRYNARRFAGVAADLRVLEPLPYFLFGFHLGRRRFPQAVGPYLGAIRKVRWSVLILALSLQAAPALTLLVPEEPGPSLQAVVRLLLGVGNGLLSVFYATVITLLARKPGMGGAS